MSSHLQTEDENQVNKSNKALYKFLFPSLFGVLIFLFPVYDGNTINIPLGVITDFVTNLTEPALPFILTYIIVISTVFTFVTTLFKPQVILNSNLLNSLFNVSAFAAVLRLIGAIFAIMTYYEIGWHFIISDVTGRNMFDLLTTLLVWFFVASFLMPYLINFGAMEFIGTLFRGVVKPLFTLPGRSAIDLLASWVGNVNVGVVITREQFQSGYYTAREAAAIATCFSTVSLPFCLVIAGMLDIEHLFLPMYITIILAGIVCAIVIPRIPPLSRVPDTHYVKSDFSEYVPEDVSRFKMAVEQATKRAERAGNLKQQIKQGNNIFLDIVFVLMPQVMAIGTVALIIAEFTPLLDIISKPMVPVLNMLQLPEAAVAAPATIVGFIDMFIPAILASGIEAEITRFFIGALSLVQIIYLTEMGTLLIISKIPIHIGHLLLIFLERTIIAIPIIALVAHIIL